MADRHPTLVLWGDQDPALLGGDLFGLDEFVRDPTVRRHASATHWIAHEEPEWLTRSMFFPKPHVMRFVFKHWSGSGRSQSEIERGGSALAHFLPLY